MARAGNSEDTVIIRSNGNNTGGGVENHSGTTGFKPNHLLTNIYQVLMEEEEEEDMDNKICVQEDGFALKAVEKSFSDELADLYHRRHNSSSGLRGDGQLNHTNNRALSGSTQFFGYFNRGQEEASKFLPDVRHLTIDTELANRRVMPPTEANKDGDKSKFVKAEERELWRRRVRKHPHHEEHGSENGRVNKQSAVYCDSTEVSPVTLDNALLWERGENYDEDAGKLRLAKAKENDDDGIYRKERVLVDLRTLVMECGQSVAANDHRTANELLREIREHSSLEGDASQRLAHYFGDGLEARLAGRGNQTLNSILASRVTLTTMLKPYELYLTACPLLKVSFFLANYTILKASRNAARLHIVDFPIGFGFQWPSFMQFLAKRPGGPPKLRMTAIGKPSSGFRPAERIEEIGKYLKHYARRFGIPFEYRAIACKAEDIRVEDLDIRMDGEVVAVSSSFCIQNETHTIITASTTCSSTRDVVLNKIRCMNPDVFVYNMMNASLSAPVFLTRFREALFYFSTVFDMLECTVPEKERQPERLFVEEAFLGRVIVNVIACEGIQRIHQWENYKEWGVRIRRAGFSQLPVGPEVLKNAKAKFGSSYHKEFFINDEDQWLLQGWKGRIMFGLSIWEPTNL